MEVIHSPFSFLSIPSPLTKQHSQQQRRTQAPFIQKQNQRHSLPSQSRFRTRALDDAIAVAAATSTPHQGNISVLLPISAVLLFMYWIANFVIPEIVMKDLEKKASEGQKPEQQFEQRLYNAANETREPMQKIKKADLKKMIKTKMDRIV